MQEFYLGAKHSACLIEIWPQMTLINTVFLDTDLHGINTVFYFTTEFTENTPDYNIRGQAEGLNP